MSPDKATQEELAELRAKVAELIEHTNSQANYHMALNHSLHTFVKFYIYRWAMWIKRIPLPQYVVREIAPLPRNDRTPVMRNGGGDAPPTVVEGETVTAPKTQRGRRYTRDDVV